MPVAVIAFAVESQCQYLRPLAFPGMIDVGLRVGKLGNSSVRYELAIFKQGEDFAAAAGYFVHVFVDRETQRPVPMPAAIRTALERLMFKNVDDERSGFRAWGRAQRCLTKQLNSIKCRSNRQGFKSDHSLTACGNDSQVRKAATLGYVT